MSDNNNQNDTQNDTQTDAQNVELEIKDVENVITSVPDQTMNISNILSQNPVASVMNIAQNITSNPLDAVQQAASLVLPQINNVETNIDKSINDSGNSLENVDKQFVKQLYEQYKNIILGAFSGKSANELDSGFWLSILVQLMVSVESIKMSGGKKKDLVIETVCLVVRNDLPIGDNEKGIVESLFRNVGPGLIDTIMFASSNININPQQVKSCLFNCFKAIKKNKK